MKSFDDFLSTLSSKEQEEITKQVMTSLANSGETFTEKELKLSAFTAQICGLSIRDLLRRYHNWLTEQMQ